jgi:hypothetical protein
MNGITIKQYMFLGAMGAISFVLAWVLGSAVNVATGTPLMGGILNGLIVGVVLTIALKVVEKFWAATILWLIFGILAIPTITLGPPGIYKIIVGLVVGFVWDIILWISKRSNAGYIIGGASMSITSMLGVLAFMILLGLPGLEKLQSIIAYLLVFYAILGAISVYIGILIYQRKIQYLASIANFKS